MKKPWIERFGDFMAGKGFYIVLFLCVAAIGISGYYLFSSLAGEGDAAVSGPARVVVTPGVTPSVKPGAKPSVSPAPSVSPTKPTVPASPATVPPASPSPSPSAAPSPSPSPSKKPVAHVFTWPVKGEILDAYSPDKQRYDPTMEDWRTHAGIDIAAEPGLQVKAAAGGTVGALVVDDLFGTTVAIDHGKGLVSVYANLAALPTVEEGDAVTTGDVIGSVGDTAKGESGIGSHLHLEFLKDGFPADPMKYLPEQN